MEIRRTAKRFRVRKRNCLEAASGRVWAGLPTLILELDVESIFEYSSARLGRALPGNSHRPETGSLHSKFLEGEEMRSLTTCSVRLTVMVLLLAAPSLLRAQEGRGVCPPKTRADNVEDRYGKTVVVDPYRWL